MITVEINSVDQSSLIAWSTLQVEQNLTDQVSSARFNIRKYGSRTFEPVVGDEVIIYDGSTKIFAGTINNFTEAVEASKGIMYQIQCVDWMFDFDADMVSQSYENETVEDIIADIVSNFTSGGFTTNNVTSEFTIDKIVFNQVKPSECLRKLAELLNYQWYIDEDKDVHFIAKYSETAPFDLQDDSGNFVYKSLMRKVDGSQIVNTVIVRGGEYNANTFESVITVSGDDTKIFNLPYKFDNLTVELDTGGGYVSQSIGVDNIDDFTSVDVLFNFQEKTIRWNSALSDGDKIKFSGNPKVPVLAIAEDSASVEIFGQRKKLIRDNTIEDLNVARQRATAELNTYANEIQDAKFKTYTSGLRTGMIINITSILRSCNTDFIIKKITSKAIDPNSFEYNVELVTTKKYEFTELLRKLLRPDPKQADDSEVAEIIKTNTDTIVITEQITAVIPEDDTATITIGETITKDPLGAGVEPEWVLADYIPSPYPTDNKRNGLLDRTFQVY